MRRRARGSGPDGRWERRAARPLKGNEQKMGGENQAHRTAMHRTWGMMCSSSRAVETRGIMISGCVYIVLVLFCFRLCWFVIVCVGLVNEPVAITAAPCTTVSFHVHTYVQTCTSHPHTPSSPYLDGGPALLRLERRGDDGAHLHGRDFGELHRQAATICIEVCGGISGQSRPHTRPSSLLLREHPSHPHSPSIHIHPVLSS